VIGGESSQSPWPTIVIRDPVCHRCEQKTFVIFEAQPWCRQHFLEELAAREEATRMPARATSS
jgi:hypothetical protein